RRQREEDADAVEREALLDVGAEAVLLVLREDAEEGRVELVLRHDRRVAALVALRELAEGEEQLLDLALRLRAGAALGGEEPPVQGDRLEEEVEDRMADLGPTEAQIVEDVLQLVREAGHLRRPKEPGEALEGVHAAEDVVDELRIGAPLPQALVDLE